MFVFGITIASLSPAAKFLKLSINTTLTFHMAIEVFEKRMTWWQGSFSSNV